MIIVRFFTKGNCICGFDFRGHADFVDEGDDIVCASVSSAAYMAANTITDVIGIDADINVKNGFMSLSIGRRDLPQAQVILEGLRLHLESLANDYPGNIKVSIIRRCRNA